MNIVMRAALFALIAISAPAVALAPAGDGAFHPGKVITGFGPIADVPGASAIRPDASFKIAFDTAKGEKGKLNKQIESAARFINMHAAAGILPDNLKTAIVIHGSAVFDAVQNPLYGAHYTPDVDDKMPNPNAPLIAALLAHGGRVIVCGQSAVAYGVKTADLLPGVEMALSAMTAHAQLQQDGYTLNPF
ncbi:MAG: DsrE family protein [Parasphingorhabdus sp.]|nr:DsrE family protein [Parasphingorhabdus sp.]